VLLADQELARLRFVADTIESVTAKARDLLSQSEAYHPLGDNLARADGA
jgi:hypothetical protein